jgi:hypothetical protein
MGRAVATSLPVVVGIDHSTSGHSRRLPDPHNVSALPPTANELVRRRERKRSATSGPPNPVLPGFRPLAYGFRA